MSKGGYRPGSGKKTIGGGQRGESIQVWTRLPQEVIDMIPEPRAYTIRFWILEALLNMSKENRTKEDEIKRMKKDGN